MLTHVIAAMMQADRMHHRRMPLLFHLQFTLPPHSRATWRQLVYWIGLCVATTVQRNDDCEVVMDDIKQPPWTTHTSFEASIQQ